MEATASSIPDAGYLDAEWLLRTTCRVLCRPSTGPSAGKSSRLSLETIVSHPNRQRQTKSEKGTLWRSYWIVSMKDSKLDSHLAIVTDGPVSLKNQGPAGVSATAASMRKFGLALVSVIMPLPDR